MPATTSRKTARPLPKIETFVCPRCGPYWLFAGDADPQAVHLAQYHAPELAQVVA